MALDRRPVEWGEWPRSSAAYRSNDRLERVTRLDSVRHPRRPSGRAGRAHPPGRSGPSWVVERAHSWTNRARRLLVRWEKKVVNYLAFVHLQFAYIALKAAGVLG